MHPSGGNALTHLHMPCKIQAFRKMRQCQGMGALTERRWLAARSPAPSVRRGHLLPWLCRATPCSSLLLPLLMVVLSGRLKAASTSQPSLGRCPVPKPRPARLEKARGPLACCTALPRPAQAPRTASRRPLTALRPTTLPTTPAPGSPPCTLLPCSLPAASIAEHVPAQVPHPGTRCPMLTALATPYIVQGLAAMPCRLGQLPRATAGDMSAPISHVVPFNCPLPYQLSFVC